MNASLFAHNFVFWVFFFVLLLLQKLYDIVIHSNSQEEVQLLVSQSCTIIQLLASRCCSQLAGMVLCQQLQGLCKNQTDYLDDQCRSNNIYIHDILKNTKRPYKNQMSFFFRNYLNLPKVQVKSVHRKGTHGTGKSNTIVIMLTPFK